MTNISQQNNNYITTTNNINYPEKIFSPHEKAMQMLHDKTTAEIAVYGIISDSQKRLKLFAPLGQYEFYVPKDYFLVGILPEDLIGFGDVDSEVTFRQNNAHCGNGNIFAFDALGLDVSDQVKTELFFFPFDKNNGTSPGGCAANNGKLNLREITNIQPNGTKPYFPMLTLLALKWSVQRGHNYSIDMVVAELFDRGFATRSELLTPIHGLPSDCWTETLSEPKTPSKSKLAYADIEYFHDPVNALGMRGLWFEDEDKIQYCFPVSYWQHKNLSLPTSFLMAPKHKMPLDRTNINADVPIVVTEYLNISRINADNKKIAVVGWLGGVTGISRTDLTPLLGRSFYYLVKMADNDTDGKRAVQVMLKFLSILKKQGFFHYKIIDTIHNDIIDENRVGLLCQRYKVDIPENLTYENCAIGLDWQPSETVGSNILGNSVQEGRLHLMHSPYGTGKTLLTQIMANILIRGIAHEFGDPLAPNTGKQFKILYIQNEMQEGHAPINDMQIRQKRLDGLFGNPLPKNMLNFYKPAEDICKISQREAITSKLAELDPEGISQWVIVIDNILSIMPSATTKSGYDKIKPWFEGLKTLGVTIFLIHHDNLEGNSYGSSAILNDADSSWHITLTDKTHDEIVQSLPSEVREDLANASKLQYATEALARVNSAARKVYVKIDKGRHLTDSDMKPFSIQWTITDAVQNLTTEYSNYSNLKKTIEQKLQEYRENIKISCMAYNLKNHEINDMATTTNSNSGFSDEQIFVPATNTERLPASFKALKGLRGEDQKLALLELRLQHGSVKAVAEKLSCSVSSIEGLCRSHNVDRPSVETYATGKIK